MGRRGRKRQRREGGGHTAAPRRPPPSTTPGRYTAPQRHTELRPDWHRPVGWLIVALGVVIAVLNDAAPFVDMTLVPGGHNELYLLLAVAIAAGGAWLLGSFDAPT